MTANAFNPRSQRGLDLARAKRQLFSRVDEHTWIVPSATCSHHVYLVDALHLTCTCPDSDEGNKCKHLWAVQYLDNEITLIDGTRLVLPPVIDGGERLTILDHGDGS